MIGDTAPAFGRGSKLCWRPLSPSAAYITGANPKPMNMATWHVVRRSCWRRRDEIGTFIRRILGIGGPRAARMNHAALADQHCAYCAREGPDTPEELLFMTLIGEGEAMD